MTQEKTCILIDMEIGSVDDEADPPILIDSGTGSFNESPIPDEDQPSAPSSQDEPQKLWELGSERKQRSVKNILDKSISVDEDSLIKPLEPVVCIVHTNNVMNNSHSIHNEYPPLMSILRRTSCYAVLGESDVPILRPRRVSFPTDLTILASYKEPDLRSPFAISDDLSCEVILTEYQNSCKKHKTIELDVIKNQIMDIKNNINHTAILNLATINLTMEVCETLEDLFKVVNFRTIIIKDCKFTSESIREFINILEYYNCSREYVISDHFKEHDAWKVFCGMASRSGSLESLSFEGFNFGDTHTHMKVLLNNINYNESIHTLKFNNCKLGNTPTYCLVEALSFNENIHELYLPQTGLYTKEADLLGKLLMKNIDLKVLDISNNLIGDRGLEVLAKGLCNNSVEGCGLSVLVIFNNQITEKSGPIISNIIAECKNLHTLNIGYNHLTDEVIFKIEKSLNETKTLEGLGLQSTLLTDKGVSKLAEAIQINTSLQKINLKGNKAIQTEGLERLSQALTKTNITKVELDETNRNCDDPKGFIELVQQINAICTVNISKPDESKDNEVTLSLYFSRKVSLNCEPIYYQPLLPEPVSNSRKKSPSPSPIPSPGCSPTPRSRFSVSRVPDPMAKTVITTSRFKVCTVSLPPQYDGAGDSFANSPPPDEEDEVKFANLRSSVSSIDSVDSLSTNRDSVYDSATPSGESD